ncbi:site-specific recombinase XerD [Dysgonomonas alginatilytica]|uniref:Site-specific recombinase XerD n=1 Tax=Dysgonomonas alginatilytica TaxID=1605892 RepID=A0A2V3PLL3_9BACT|nr:site-specific integrase [Dysgonomonas alginatilytica]PXV60123.1 site-specific recombinase XerD [Dysgonomonas alginatilytica]
MKYNRSTFSILFYLNTSKKKKSGKCPIMGRISVDAESKAFSIGMDIEPKQWDAAKGMAVGKLDEVFTINKQIETLKSELEQYYRNMVENQGFVTAELLKNALRGIGTVQNTVMQEFPELIEEKRKSIGIRIVASSYAIYPAAYRHFKGFLKHKYDSHDIPFGMVNGAMIEEYDYYLKIDARLSLRTAKSTMKPFRTVAMRAFNKGLLRNDPFFDYTPEKIISNPRWLCHDEIDRLMKLEIKSPAQNFVRDMFLFSVFTGISYIDLKNLQYTDIQQQADGSLWIILNRQKTGATSYIPLLDIPKKIIDKYKDTKFSGNDGKIFKIRSSTSVNGHLKELAKAGGINKRLCYHMSRHSFGTEICLSGGVPIETVSRMMGHLSIKTTQIYAEATRTKINEDMTKLAERIEGKYTLA